MRPKFWIYLALITIGGVFAVRQWMLPIPASTVQMNAHWQAPGRLQLHWPQGPQVAVAVNGTNHLIVHGSQTPQPIGSVAKVMTAYLFLQKYPLRNNSTGPTFVVSKQQAGWYQHDIQSQQSVVKVTAGQHLTERQVLESLLIASANNVANMTAQWVSGSRSRFVNLMNKTAQKLGLHHTRYVSPSGFTAGTVSTARDQTRLGELAIHSSSAFRHIVALGQMSWPHQKYPIENFNYVLGQDGINGIKTGSTLSAGGCFVFSAQIPTYQSASLYGAIVGQRATAAQPSQLMQSEADAQSLITQINRQWHPITIVKRGEILGHLITPWGRHVAIKSEQSLTVMALPGLRTHLVIREHAWVHATVEITWGNHRKRIPIHLASNPIAPIWWRLLRI